MGRLIRLHGVNLTEDAPRIITRDPIESNGSLMLFDGGSVDYGFNGLPDAGEAIPNVLSHYLKSIVGGNPSNASLNFTVANKSPNSSAFLAERTLKGGIHGINSLTNQSEAVNYKWLGPEAVRDWIVANPNHSYYISYWGVVTRVGVDNAAEQSPFHFTSQFGATNNFHFHFQGGKADSAISPTYYTDNVNDDHFSGRPTPYTRYSAVQIASMTGNGVTATDNIALLVGIGDAWQSFNINAGASRILYRAYIEDLSISGRSFNTVNDIDTALYAAAFSEGGKFYNDSYTSPSSIP
ncbi:hypothetical protein SAMN05216361_0054 [Marisediminitalea aggregata]|uniref:Uncharacterized protein n=1 Tax=Marisediminitalea aggregata TaxID=634436 RepID=A0A1M5SPB2_9ALTE|nr:hypothetical protein [Marisediminitalea aggregata]SHH40336.1 hypothetical protein SAMN05216361_0054 [Marisediminitalea aggregata]